MCQEVKKAIENGEIFFNSLQSNAHSRYKSWEHCFLIFANYKGKKLHEEDIDYLCLHLSFYLASWGMYRGSSFLLQRDYKIHASVVKELMEDKYLSLWSIKCEEYIKEETKSLDLLFDLRKKLESIYSEVRESVNEELGTAIPESGISEILISKILMGTLGCVPAYDRFFVSGIKKHGFKPATFSEKNIRELSTC